MKSRKQLNVAMIGQGFMGRAHSNAFHQVGHFCEPSYDLRLKIICGRNQPQLKAMARWEEVASDWQAVLARKDKDIDVIDVCTPI
jgi:predicted dehydrogenase